MYILVMKNGEASIESFDPLVKFPLVEFYQVKHFAYGVDSDDFVWVIAVFNSTIIRRLSLNKSEEFLRLLSSLPHGASIDLGKLIERMIKTEIEANPLVWIHQIP